MQPHIIDVLRCP